MAIAPDVSTGELDFDAALLDLQYGNPTVVQRWTELVTARRVRCEIPCCAKTGGAPARAIELPVDLAGEDIDTAVCPACGLLWSVALLCEEDGGWLATFTLAGRVAVASSRRAYTRAL